MHRTDPCGSQHCIGRLGDHWHIKDNPVAFLDAQFLINIRQTTDVLVQFLIGDMRVIFGVVPLPDDGNLITTVFQMSVNAIGRNIQFPVFEPLDRNVRVLKRGVFHLCIRLDPVEAMPLLAPEGLRIANGFRIHRLVLIFFNQRRRNRFFRGWVNMLFHGFLQ